MKAHDIQARCSKCDKRVTAVMSYEQEDYDKGYRNHFKITCKECNHHWYESHD
jgi:uncharacterized protein with PIN domain